ncbi:hypothetical protein J8A87_19550 [Vibrio parahaemolyticus]|uniref:Uncharacterized protein n=1 Tax=Vibrio fluvialis PG41 TaxID=1336752 RepID=S7JEQ1_VIBFL|nr:MULTISPECIES: hypothetical protein [Vibrio]EPP20650.1 hypothetical protein L910_1766 [Vibrio fluvialis PG41]MBE4779599.1 hypothetical protein [Vibrio parahaemolyticus]MCF9166653.1 hypothetical protein [Vibrio parahaemolyticus]MDW1967796.1 hypothetical protein [Vibrio sp. Vb0587]
MKLTASISRRDLLSLLQDLPIEKSFSTAHAVGESDISAVLNQNSQKSSKVDIYPYDRHSGSRLNEFRELMGVCIKDDFIFKQYLNKVNSNSANNQTERQAEAKLSQLEYAFSNIASPTAKDLSMSEVITSYKRDGLYSLQGKISNPNEIKGFATKIDSFLISLNHVVSSDVTMVPKMGLTQRDVQCIVVADHLYDDISEILKDTNLHAVTKSVYEKSNGILDKKKESALER